MDDDDIPIVYIYYSGLDTQSELSGRLINVPEYSVMLICLSDVHGRLTLSGQGSTFCRRVQIAKM
jgi:hypothetical protein